MPLNDLRLQYTALSYIAHRMGDQKLSSAYLQGAEKINQMLEQGEPQKREK